MGYRVEYQSVRKVRGVEKRTSSLPALIGLCLMLFLLLVGSCWPRGAQVLRGLVMPGNPSVTAAALEDFALELKAGEALPSALEGFCRRVIQEAEVDLD